MFYQKYYIFKLSDTVTANVFTVFNNVFRIYFVYSFSDQTQIRISALFDLFMKTWKTWNNSSIFDISIKYSKL